MSDPRQFHTNMVDNLVDLYGQNGVREAFSFGDIVYDIFDTDEVRSIHAALLSLGASGGLLLSIRERLELHGLHPAVIDWVLADE